MPAVMRNSWSRYSYSEYSKSSPCGGSGTSEMTCHCSHVYSTNIPDEIRVEGY